MKKYLHKLVSLCTATALVMGVSVASFAQTRLLPPKTGSGGTTASTSASDKKAASESEQILLTVKAINCGDNQTLGELVNSLNASVTAKDKATNKVIKGQSKWVASGKTVIKERTSNHEFVFYPEDQAYMPVKGTARINAAINALEVVIQYNASTLYVTEGERLRDITKMLRDAITVEDPDGNTVSYSIQWKKSPGSKFNERASSPQYTFIVKPSSTRYLPAEGAIYIQSIDG